MTIEALLTRNNELLEQLIAKFDHIGAAVSAPATEAKGAGASAPAEKGPDKAPAAQAASAAVPPAVPAPAASAPAAPVGPLDYDRDIKGPALAFVAKKGREGLVQLLKDFKVENARDVPVERRQEFLDEMKKRTAA